MTEKAKILFVDDEKQILISLRALFRSKYQVFTANSGEEALDIVRKEHIHAIISDQRMPKMLGAEVLREVKKISPSTMRLLLTGYSDLDAIIGSINEGEVFRFINKPWDNEQIRATVDAAVQIALNTVRSISVNNEEESLESEKPEYQGAGILVIDDSVGTWDTVRQLFQNTHTLYGARTIDEAVEILGREEVSVIISEVTIGGEDVTEFIKTLKQQYPLIMSIIMTEIRDSDMAIDLINQGQIYRYLNKPIRGGLLRLSVNSAIQHYYTNREKPELLERHRVEKIKEIYNPSLKGRLIEQLKSLRRRFGFSF